MLGAILGRVVREDSQEMTLTETLKKQRTNHRNISRTSVLGRKEVQRPQDRLFQEEGQGHYDQNEQEVK